MKGLISLTFQFFLKLSQFCQRLGQFCQDMVKSGSGIDSVVSIVIVTIIVMVGVSLIGHLILTLKHK
jgi:hypothetical protein